MRSEPHRGDSVSCDSITHRARAERAARDTDLAASSCFNASICSAACLTAASATFARCIASFRSRSSCRDSGLDRTGDCSCPSFRPSSRSASRIVPAIGVVSVAAIAACVQAVRRATCHPRHISWHGGSNAAPLALAHLFSLLHARQRVCNQVAP